MGVDASVAEAVVLSALLGVAQDMVGLVEFFKLGFGVRALVAIGVIFHRLAAIGTAYVLLRRVALDFKDFVVVAF